MRCCNGGWRIAAVLLLALAVTDAYATAQRTFVASTGSDANACSLIAPCRSLGAALTQTSSGGEVIVLDSAGYGPVTIAQSVSIVAPPGVYAGISVFSGNGITVNGSNINVALRGLTINGQGGATGIAFTNGARLIVDRCTLTNLTTAGVFVQATGPAKATLTNIRVEGSHFGVAVADNADVAVRDSQLSYNDRGVYVASDSTGAPARAEIDRTVIDHNAAYGVEVDASFSPATAYISDSHVERNGIGIGGFVGAPVYATDSRIVSIDKEGALEFISAAFVLSGNVISGNGGGGVHQYDVGFVFTMNNNVVRDNPGGNILGGPLVSLTFD